MIKQKGFIDPAVAVVTALVIIGAATLFVGGLPVPTLQMNK